MLRTDAQLRGTRYYVAWRTARTEPLSLLRPVDESRIQGLTVQVDVHARRAIEDAAKLREDAPLFEAAPKKR